MVKGIKKKPVKKVVKKVVAVAKTKPFSRLSKKDKKITICQDVIDQIKTKKIAATHGTYFTLPVSNDLSKTKGKELQTILKETKEPCEACAIGSIFICDIIKRDNFAVENGHIEQFKDYYWQGDDLIPTIRKTEIEIRSDEMVDKVSDYFSELELRLIETAFEREVITDVDGKLKDDDDWDTNLALKAIRFGNRYEKDENRLIGIMKNVIKNGEFKP